MRGGQRFWSLRGLTLIALAGALSACGESNSFGSDERGSISIDGSSTVFPIMTRAAQLFTTDNPDVQVVVEFSGTSGGFRKFCAGETDINAASRDINSEEIRQCAANGVEFVRLPVATDAIAIVTHPSNRWLESVTVEQLQTLWSAESEGRITKWSDVDPQWPDRNVNLYGRGQDSGTYDYFTSQLTGLRQSRQDYVASEDEEYLATRMAGDRDAIGFFGLGAYHRHWDELRLVGVDNGNGPVFPALETANSGRYQPLTRPLYMYVRTPEDDVLRSFLQHTYTNIGDWIHFTGYIPLTEQTYRVVVSQLAE